MLSTNCCNRVGSTDVLRMSLNGVGSDLFSLELAEMNSFGIEEGILLDQIAVLSVRADCLM